MVAYRIKAAVSVCQNLYLTEIPSSILRLSSKSIPLYATSQTASVGYLCGYYVRVTKHLEIGLWAIETFRALLQNSFFSVLQFRNDQAHLAWVRLQVCIYLMLHFIIRVRIILIVLFFAEARDHCLSPHTRYG